MCSALHSALNSYIHHILSFDVECISCTNSTPFENDFLLKYLITLNPVFFSELKIFYEISKYPSIIEQILIKGINTSVGIDNISLFLL